MTTSIRKINFSPVEKGKVWHCYRTKILKNGYNSWTFAPCSKSKKYIKCILLHASLTCYTVWHQGSRLWWDRHSLILFLRNRMNSILTWDFPISGKKKLTIRIYISERLDWNDWNYTWAKFIFLKLSIEQKQTDCFRYKW